MAERRPSSLKKRLTLNTVLCNKYLDVLETFIGKGYARRVPYNLLVTNNAKWYLPHHPVLHPCKPNKVRVVFDCAAKHKGISLNDALYQGPVLTNSLVGVLIRFRENPIALVADIEQMFHQINVDTIDCDALRFLWWPSGNLTEPPVTYQTLVHCLELPLHLVVLPSLCIELFTTMARNLTLLLPRFCCRIFT